MPREANTVSTSTIVGDSLDTDATTVENLVNRGISLKQLLSFYGYNSSRGRITARTTTADVVKNIIIPETSDDPRCYMESSFMQENGGTQRARRFVSHAWQSRFVDLVLNLVLDASEWNPREFIDFQGEKKTGKTYFSQKHGTLDAKKLMEHIPQKALDKSYWICIFAVNEHLSICGNCSRCHMKVEWAKNSSKYLCADPCLLCGKRKCYPCSCHSPKCKLGELECEIDKFPLVLQKMECLVVSLDPTMSSLKRLWVVAEIGQAVDATKAVHFRQALGLAPDTAQMLTDGRDLMTTVEDCMARFDEDRELLLNIISTKSVKTSEHDALVNCMLEISLGRCSRLQRLSAFGAASIGVLYDLHMDFRWHQDMESITEEFFGDPGSFTRLGNLHHLTLNFKSLNRLTSVDGLGKRIGLLQKLTVLRMDFGECSALKNLHDLSDLKFLKKLMVLEADFSSTGIEDLSSLGHGTEGLSSLKHLDVNFKTCAKLSEIPALGRGINGVQYFKAKFPETNVKSTSAFGEGISDMKEMVYLEFDFYSTPVQDITTIGEGLREMNQLQHLDLNFHKTSIPKIAKFSSGITGLKNLKYLDANFRFCSDLSDISALGRSLQELEELQHVKLTFYETNVKSIGTLGEGLGQSKKMQHLELDFYGTPINSLISLAHSLREMTELCHLELNFSGTKVSDLVALEESIGRLRNLQHLELYFRRTNVRDLSTLGIKAKELPRLRLFLVDLRYSCVNKLLDRRFESPDALAKAVQRGACRKFLTCGWCRPCCRRRGRVDLEVQGSSKPITPGKPRPEKRRWGSFSHLLHEEGEAPHPA